MTKEDIVEYQRKEKVFAETELGKSFLKFKSRLHRAVVQDTEDGFTDRYRKSTIVAWDEANEAEREFRELVKRVVTSSGCNNE